MTVVTPPAPHARTPPVARADAGLEPPLRPVPFTLRQLLWLLGITALAGLLRIWQLGEWSIWVDEAHTWRDVTVPLDHFLAGDRNWYPTSYLFLRFFMEAGALPQFTEEWLRLPFAVCGIATVPMLAFYGKLMVGPRAALLAALFLTINPWHIYWSQNARAYVLVCMFSVLGAGMFWLGVSQRRHVWTAGGVLAALVAGSCHVTGLVLLPVFVAYPLLAAPNLPGRRWWVAAFAGGIALMLVPNVFELVPPFQIFQRAKPDASFLHLVETTAFYFRLPLLCAAGLGVWMLFQSRLQGRVLYLALWALLPLVLLGIVGSTLVKVTARYALCALPAVLLLAGAASLRMSEVLARGLGTASRWSRWLPAAMLPAILCLDMVAYDYLYYTVQHGDRGRWREARDFVLTAAGSKPVTLCTTNDPTLNYYLRPNHYGSDAYLRPPADGSVGRPDGPVVLGISAYTIGVARDGTRFLRDQASEAKKQGRELFVVASMPELREIDSDGSVRRGLRSDFELVHVLPCWVGPKDESIYVWQVRGPR